MCISIGQYRYARKLSALPNYVCLPLALAAAFFLFCGLPSGSARASERLARFTIHTETVSSDEVKATFDRHFFPVLQRHGFARTGPTAVLEDALRITLKYSGTDSFVAVRARVDADPGWAAAFNRASRDLGPDWTLAERKRSLKFLTVARWPAGPGRLITMDDHTRRKTAGRGHWHTYSVVDGLAGGTVMDVVQAPSGEILYGTETGPGSFDGLTWHTFEIKDLPGFDRVNDLYRSLDGSIYFATHGGLAAYSDGNLVPLALPVDDIPTSVTIDGTGRLWLGTANQGLLVLDAESMRVQDAITSDSGLPRNEVQALLEDDRGRIWAATADGVAMVVKDGGTTSVSVWLAGQNVKTLVTDDNGLMWAGTSSGAFWFDGASWHDSGPGGAGRESVRVIFRDCDGLLWFGVESGLLSFDGDEWSRYTHEDGLPGGAVISAMQDDEGHLWFGTYRGLVRYDAETFASYTVDDGLPDNRVTGITQDGDGRIWFATKGGLVSVASGAWTVWTGSSGLPEADIRAAATDASGQAWFGSHGAGLYRTEGNALRVYGTADGLPHGEVWSLNPTSDGDLWIGTWNGRSVTRFDGILFESHIIRGPDPDDVYRPHKVWDVLPDRRGVVWVATNGAGIVKGVGGAPKRFQVENGLASDEVRAILEDSDGNLWFGTKAGLVRYDGSGFRAFDERDGLLHAEIRSLYEGRDGHIWVGTRGGGVSRFDGRTFVSMTTRDGLAGNQVLCIYQDREGSLWFGTNSGVTRYTQPEPTSPGIEVTVVEANRRYLGPRDISFPSTTEWIRFSFKGRSMKTRPDAIRFEYRMIGYDDTWRVTSDPFAEFSDIAAGEYRFEVKAIDRDLVYSSQPAVVQVTVHPPYGRYAFIGVLAIAVGVAAFQTKRALDRGRALRGSYAELVRSHDELERVQAERLRLDEQVQSLDYVSRLRLSLSNVQAGEEAITRTGKLLKEVLGDGEGGSVQIEWDGKSWYFGAPQSDARAYERSLAWGGRERGRLVVLSSLDLPPVQEQTLLDVTAGQLSRTLEAQELGLQLLQSARLASVGEMSAGVAHELNQPLGGISATSEDFYLRLEQGQPVSEDQWRGMLKRILGMADRMSRTIEHLLVFSRDSTREKPRWFWVNDLIDDAIGIIGTQLRNHAIRLDKDLSAELPRLRGEPRQIEQVILNVLANARDAVDERGQAEPEFEKRIEVRTRRSVEGVVIEVEDNGVGIAADDLRHVFEPFYTTKAEGKGTGLGLSISSAIIRNHAGEIEVESEKGRTVFRVVLPMEI